MVETAPKPGPKMMVISPDGALFAVDSQVRETQSGRLLCTVNAGRRGTLLFSRDGLQLASGGDSAEILVWDLKHCGVNRSVDTPFRRFESAATLPDGRVLISADSGVYLADLFGTAPRFAPLAAPARAKIVALGGTGNIALLDDGGSLLILDIAANRATPLAEFSGAHETTGSGTGRRGRMPGVQRRVAAVSRSGRWIIAQTSGSSELTLYDRNARRAVATAANSAGTAATSDGLQRALPGMAGRPFAPALDLEFSADEAQIAALYNMDETMADGTRSRILIPAALHVLRRTDLTLTRSVRLMRDDDTSDAPLRPTFHNFSLSTDNRTLALYGQMGQRDAIAVVDLSGSIGLTHLWALGAGRVNGLAWTADGALIVLNRGGAVVRTDPDEVGRERSGAAVAAPEAQAPPVNSRFAMPVSYTARWDLVHSGLTITPIDNDGYEATISADGQFVGYRTLAIVNSGIELRVGVSATANPIALWTRKVDDLSHCARGAAYAVRVHALAPDGHALLVSILSRQSSRDEALCVVSANSDEPVQGPTERMLTGVGGVQARFTADARSIEFVKAGGVLSTYNLAAKVVQPGPPLPTQDAVTALPGLPRRMVASTDDEQAIRRNDPHPSGYSYVFVPMKHPEVTPDAQGRRLAVTNREGTLELYALTPGDHLANPRVIALPDSRPEVLAFSPDGRFLAGAFDNGATLLWDAESGALKASLYTFPDGSWVVIDPQGRFDTNNLDDSRFLHWIMPNEPLHAYPIEIFMRDYFEPRLLTRIMTGEKFSPVRPLATLNKVQPKISIVGVEAEAGHADTVTVSVQIENVRNAVGQHSGVHQLHLLRDHHLVGLSPESSGGPAVGKSAIVKFPGIRLATGAHEVQFSAYAFNDDHVKSETGRLKFTPGAAVARPGRAFVIVVGVNDYENPALNLGFAANDARAVLDTVTARLKKTGQFREVIGVPLISEVGGSHDATKAHLEAAVSRLAGKATDANVLNGIANAEKLERATPDDLIVLSFSGHGYAGDHGDFYVIPQEAGRAATKGVTPQVLASSISSDEWAKWLLPVDAGDIAVIIDACHSAASIEGSGFKPGPMGSRGLGQLAYDKGIRILTASQAADVALESSALQHGLLTYALIIEGIESGRADYQPVDKQIDLLEWLSFGAARVPQLYAEINHGTFVPPGNRGLQRIGMTEVAQRIAKGPAVQQPALFDFNRGIPGPLIVHN